MSSLSLTLCVVSTPVLAAPFHHCPTFVYCFSNTHVNRDWHKIPLSQTHTKTFTRMNPASRVAQTHTPSRQAKRRIEFYMFILYLQPFAFLTKSGSCYSEQASLLWLTWVTAGSCTVCSPNSGFPFDCDYRALSTHTLCSIIRDLDTHTRTHTAGGFQVGFTSSSKSLSTGPQPHAVKTQWNLLSFTVSVCACVCVCS